MVICYFLGYGIFSDSSRVPFVKSARHTEVVEIYIFTRLFLAFSGNWYFSSNVRVFTPWKLFLNCSTNAVRVSFQTANSNSWSAFAPRFTFFPFSENCVFFLNAFLSKKQMSCSSSLQSWLLFPTHFLGENGVKDISISRRDLSLFLGINLVSVSPLHCIHLNAFLAKGSGNFARYSFFCLACVTIKFT